MDKIKEIILNDNYKYLDIIILIWRELYNNKGLSELSARLNIPVAMLKAWDMEKVEIKKVPKQIGIKKYIDLFYDNYEKLYNNKYKFIPMEIGQVKNIMKTVSVDEWEKILKLVFHICKKHDKGEKLSFAWKQICENVRPSSIYSKLNFILKEIKLIEKAKSEGRFRNDSKKNK